MPSSSFQKHHAFEQRTLRNSELLDYLQSTGSFNIDGEGNLIHLPNDPAFAKRLGLTPHSGGPISNYQDGSSYWLDRLERTPDGQAALEGDLEAEARITPKVELLRDTMRVGLINGDLHTNAPFGMTANDIRPQVQGFFQGLPAYQQTHVAQIDALRSLQGPEVGWASVVHSEQRIVSTLDYMDQTGRNLLRGGQPELARTTLSQAITQAHSNGRLTLSNQGILRFQQSFGEEAAEPLRVPRSMRGSVSPELLVPEMTPGRVVGALAAGTLVADAVHTGHRFETLLAQDNLLGAQHELRNFGANNANAWVAAYTVGKLGAELGGRRGVQGAIAGGIAGGIVGYVMSDKAMAGVDAREINKQVDAQGRHWEFDGNQWMRPMDADLSSTGQVQQVNFAADLDSRRELDYKATNKSVEIGMRRLSEPRDPYSLPASDQDKGSLREANWTRDPGTGQWHRDRIADVDPNGRNIHDFQTATAERAAQLDQQASKVIEANIANGPAPIAARYQIAHQLNGWEGPEPAAVSAALDANSLQASDGNQYRRGIDGQWRHGEDVAQGNLAAELNATREALQPQLQSHEQVMAQLPEWQRPTQAQEDLSSLAQTYRGFGLAPSPETLAAVQLAVNTTRAEQGIDPATTSLALDPNAQGKRDITSPVMHLQAGNDGAVRVVGITSALDVELARRELRAQGFNLNAPGPTAPEQRIEAQSPQQREAYTQALREANRQGVSTPDVAQIATLAAVQVRALGREDRDEPQVEPEVRQVRDPVATEQPTRAVEPIPPVVEAQTQEPEKVARDPGQPQPAAPELQSQERVQATEQPVPVVAATPAPQVEAQRPQQPMQANQPEEPQDQERHEQPPPAQKVSEAPAVEPRQPEPVVATEPPAPDQPGLRLGDRGPDVEFLQHRLQRAGASGPEGQPVPLDGTYGVETQHAVREFQQAQGLPPTGVADQALDEALVRAPQVRQEPVARVESEQPVQAAPEQVVERPSPEQREVQAQAVAEAQRQSAAPEQVQQVAAQAVDQGQTVERRIEVSEPSRAYAGPSMSGGGRSIERDEQQEPTQRQAQSQGFPTDHHDYALFVAIQQQLPKNTPDEKTAELMHQAKLGGIKRPDQLDEVVVENDRAWVFGKTAGSYSQEVPLGAPAPAMNETLQRNQDFDQQQALQMQQFMEQQARINQNPTGPTMTM